MDETKSIAMARIIGDSIIITIDSKYFRTNVSFIGLKESKCKSKKNDKFEFTRR